MAAALLTLTACGKADPAAVEHQHLLVEGADVAASEAEGRLLARVDPRTRARPGEPFTVVLNLAQLHAFDLQTREAIPLR